MWLLEHVFAQPPQCAGSAERPVSQPFEATLSQLPNPAWHADTTHVDAAHPATA